MLTPTQFRQLTNGSLQGLRAGMLRTALAVAEVPYTAAVNWRNWRFDRGHASVQHAGVPVVSVGNITLGGTGKTPFVAWLVRRASELGVKAAIISRGYGARAGSPNDEAAELSIQLPGVPHLANVDRVSAARQAVRDHACRLIVLDDGFQHRRLRRDLDIVLIDAIDPFGGGRVFPRGLLREPLAGLARADCIALSRADAADDRRRSEIRSQVAHFAPRATWIEVRHAPRLLRAASGREACLDVIRGQTVAAFCGIGNPQGFQHTLQQCGYRVAAFREFHDHYYYRPEDRSSIEAMAQRVDAKAILCTAKDLVKIGVDTLGDRPVWAVEIGLEVLKGFEELDARLRAVLPAAADAQPTG